MSFKSPSEIRQKSLKARQKSVKRPSKAPQKSVKNLTGFPRVRGRRGRAAPGAAAGGGAAPSNSRCPAHSSASAASAAAGRRHGCRKREAERRWGLGEIMVVISSWLAVVGEAVLMVALTCRRTAKARGCLQTAEEQWRRRPDLRGEKMGHIG